MTAPVDNTDLITPFIDEQEDGDTFWYTELLDRRSNGSSRFKLLRSFEHRCRAHFLEQLATIRALCESNGLRAYTRLSPRSRKQVAHHMARKVLEQVLEGHYDALYHAYSSACGATSIHGRKLWLYDLDAEHLGETRERLTAELRAREVLAAEIPSRAGVHLIAKPHHVTYELGGVAIHKDNPTNLYVPASAR